MPEPGLQHPQFLADQFVLARLARGDRFGFINLSFYLKVVEENKSWCLTQCGPLSWNIRFLYLKLAKIPSKLQANVKEYLRVLIFTV